MLGARRRTANSGSILNSNLRLSSTLLLSFPRPRVFLFLLFCYLFTFSLCLLKMEYFAAVTEYLDPQIPTVDRPFGIHLWSVFSDVCTRFLGWNPDEFAFIQGGLLLSTLQPMIVTIIFYYVVIFGGRELMKSSSPFKLTFLFRVHNLMLTFASGLLLALFFEQLFPILYRDGLFYAICNSGSWTQPMVTLYYVSFFLRRAPLPRPSVKFPASRLKGFAIE